MLTSKDNQVETYFNTLVERGWSVERRWKMSRRMLITLNGKFRAIHETPDKQKTSEQFNQLVKIRKAALDLFYIRIKLVQELPKPTISQTNTQ